MELCTRFCVLFFGLLILVSCFLLFECRKIDGYNFPVYSTKQCPKNKKEWNQRFSAINCTEKNGYVCLPNEKITELLEFCHTNKHILIQEGICLYLNKRNSALYPYNCSGFLSGCPNTSYISNNLFEKPDCTSIGNGCFLAEPSCQSLTVNILDDAYHNKLDQSRNMVLVGTTFGVFIIIFIISCLIINQRKVIPICKRHDNVETQETGESLLLSAKNQHALTELDDEGSFSNLVVKECHNLKKENGLADDVSSELPLDQALIEQWKKDDKFFVETNACKIVEMLTKRQNIAMVTGHTGSGKSAILHHIALKYRREGWDVKPVHTVMEMINILKSSKSILRSETIFVLNDPIGKESFDEIQYTTFRRHEDIFYVSFEKFKLFMSCRKYILNEKKVRGILKDDSNIVDINNDKSKLSKNEKENILSKYASKENLSTEELTQIVQTEAYFPLLCKLCFSDKNKAREKLRFFTEPVEVLEEEINNFENSFKDKYCALVLLVLFNNDFCVEDIQESLILTEKYVLALKLCGMKKSTAPHTLDNAYETLQGFFVKKIIDNYHFYHDFVMEVTTYVFGKRCPLETIKYADIGFLRKRVTLECSADNSNQFTICLKDKYIEAFGKRLFEDIFEKRLLDVVLNPCLKNENVIDILIDEFKKHPEKHQELLKKKKLQIDYEEINQTSNLFWSKLSFISLEEKISPLSAIIIFCDPKLSFYCLNALGKNPKNLIGNSIFTSVCCCGSKSVYDVFIKDHIKKCMAEQWNSLFPIHIAAAFNNNEMLRELLKNGADPNLKTTDENACTPLTFAAEPVTEHNEENDTENASHSKRKESVELLLSEGADINLCKKNGASPLYIACQEGHSDIVNVLLSRGAKINLCMKNGASPLLIACKEEHVDIVQQLLSNGANINTSMENGSSPLLIACQKEHYTIVEILLKNKADINCCMEDGTSPLIKTCECGYENIVQILLDNRADINCCTINGVSPLHAACERGHKSIVKLLLSKGANLYACTKDGASPLFKACQNGHESIVQVLLSKGADINACTNDRTSPLNVVCEHGYESIVHLLLSNGADIKMCKRNGVSPLHTACEHGRENIVKLLLCNGADKNACTQDGTSPLFKACQNGHVSIVQLLLNNENDFSLCNKTGVSVQTASELEHDSIAQQLLLNRGSEINSCMKDACIYGRESIVQLLLNNGADINFCNENGYSPLHIACEYGHKSIVQLLLSKGAKINSRTENGASPLHIACKNGQTSVVQLLLSKGANKKSFMKDGASPLHIACEHECENIVQLLLTNGANINFCKRNGASPLHIACQHGNFCIVELLLDNRADINLCNELKVSPLYIACQNGHDRIVQSLLRSGANINLCNVNGVSPLYIACQHGHGSIVEHLLLNGADINLCDRNGTSPLFIARKKKHAIIEELLLKNGADFTSSKEANSLKKELLY